MELKPGDVVLDRSAVLCMVEEVAEVVMVTLRPSDGADITTYHVPLYIIEEEKWPIHRKIWGGTE